MQYQRDRSTARAEDCGYPVILCTSIPLGRIYCKIQSEAYICDETNDCGSSLIPGASCAVTITYSPTIVGSQSGAITLTGRTAISPWQFL